MLASVSHLQADDVGVLVERHLDVGDVIAAMRVGDEGFGALGGPFHRPVDLLRRPGDERFLGVVVDLRAEAAADVGRIDAQLVLGDLQHERAHQQADHVRVLARGVERVVAGRQLVVADRGARLHRVRHEAVVDEVELGDVRGLGEGGIDGGLVAQLPVVAEVVGRLVVHGLRRCRRSPSSCRRRRAARPARCRSARRRCAPRRGSRRSRRRSGSPTWRTLPDGQDRVLGLLHRLAVLARHLPAARKAADGAGRIDVGLREDGDDAGRVLARAEMSMRADAARAPRSSAGCSSRSAAAG